MSKPTYDELVQVLAGVADFCLGASLDPSLPLHFRQGLANRNNTLQVIVDAASEEDDFLAGSKACDLSGDGTCEACQ